MNGVKYLLGSERITAEPLSPWSNEVVSFCADLSAALMKSSVIREYPDVSAFAFWCRKGNLQRLKSGYPEADKRLGRGLCFHIAPGNIPINFAFSYIFGVLAGCSNLVRLPSRGFPQVTPVCEIIGDVLSGHSEIEGRTAFVSYPSNSDATKEFSAMADARMIWGGDETVKTIRAMSTKPRCVDICFADRYSICIIDGQAVAAADDNVLKRLAQDFYNDTYLMDQNACSSPQLVLWLNDRDEVRSRFWNAVYAFAEKRYGLQGAISVDKYAQMCKDAVELQNLTDVKRCSNVLYRAELSALEADMTALRGTGGYFYEAGLDNLDGLTEHITERYQTVTYFGVNPENIREFVINNQLPGIDRIVPVGKAMDIGIIWDGFDLARMLSRLVNAE